MWKKVLIVSFAIVIQCAAGVESLSTIIKWYPTMAISDSSGKTLIYPGIVQKDTLDVTIGDTLFRIDQYTGISGIRTFVWRKATVCKWMQESYESINFDLERLEEEYQRIVESREETLERRRMLIDWYKKFKTNYGIDCQEVTK